MKKLNTEGAVLRFRKKVHISEYSHFSEDRKALFAYQNLYKKTFDSESVQSVLLTGIDMINALKCLPNQNNINNKVDVMDCDKETLNKLNELDERYAYHTFIESAQKYSLILAHGSAIPDFEKVENLCHILGKGSLYIKIETGNIAGLNQFEKLRLFFGTKKDVLVSTYPLNEESDIMLIEKKWA